MKAVRVYDLPTRVFHWCFAVLFVTAYAIANLVDDESARFAWHMLAGIALGVAVLLRLVWGVVGTRHARWSDLSLDPRQLAAYLKGVVAGGGRRWVGHNPASSWAALTMMALALALGGSGLAGLLALYGLLRHPSVFGWALCLDPDLALARGRVMHFAAKLQRQKAFESCRLFLDQGLLPGRDLHRPEPADLPLTEGSMLQARLLEQLQSLGLMPGRQICQVRSLLALPEAPAWSSRQTGEAVSGHPPASCWALRSASRPARVPMALEHRPSGLPTTSLLWHRPAARRRSISGSQTAFPGKRPPPVRRRARAKATRYS